MSVAILTLGTRGNVQPYAALGTGLRESGHEVCPSSPARALRRCPTLLFFFALVLAVSYWFVLLPDRWRGSRADDGERKGGGRQEGP